MSNYLLEMKNICKSFPGVKALQGVNFQLLPGEIHALLGENGAGKSTLIKVLGGIYIAEEGEIIIDGKQVTINNVNAARENGISIIHQELVQVPRMTVAENIFLGREPMGAFGVDTRRMVREAQAMLDRFDLGIDAAAEVYELSIAQQQMVEIVKAISFNCRILVMDEPTSSISDREVEQLFDIMRNLVKQGVGIIYISHKMSELNEVCDRVTVLRDGTYVGTREVVSTPRDELIAMMVGRELSNYYTRDHVKNTPVVFKCEHIDDNKKIHKRVNDVSFEVRQGEIVGFAGLIGAGRTELMKTIFGAYPKSEGEVFLDGQSVQIHSPQDAIAKGIAYVSEDRRGEGLILNNNVKFNMGLVCLRDFVSGVRVKNGEWDDMVEQYRKRFSIRLTSPKQLAGDLSGGNQQKVVLSKWLAEKPKVIILDEPTRGIDVGAKAEIYAIIDELASQGVSIIIVSSELPEIINMCNRCYVMCEGAITGELDESQFDQETMMDLMTTRQ